MQTAIRCMFVLQEKHDKSPTCHVCLFDLKGQAKLAEIFNLNYTRCIVSIAFNSLVHHFLIQPYPVTTLIHDPGFTTVSKKFVHSFVPGLVHRLPTKACPLATNQGLSTGYQSRLVHRLPTKACPGKEVRVCSSSLCGISKFVAIPHLINLELMSEEKN